VLKTLIFFIYLVRTGIKASISKRGAFLIECGLMIANNLIFLSIWWIFFRQFNHVAGWDFNDMIILMAVVTGGYGLMQICFGGVRELSKMITSGDLDPFMTQPKNLLLHVAGSKSFSKGWGNLLTAITLIILGGITAPSTICMILLSILCSCVVFTSFSVIAHSLPFWMGSVEGLAKKYCDALFLFAVYPTNIYSGVLQVVMFTLIPAGVISYLPVELARQFSWLQLFLLVGSSLGFLALAFFVFYAGLKRYESGNRFGMRL
jgi:ABC-2 type transport system permease protein